MARTLIRGGFVASQDPDFGDQPDADVLIEDWNIVAVGQNLDVGDAEITDATNCIVLPGFIDGHRHIWQGPLRGVCADWSIMDYASRIRLNAARHFTPEDMYAAQLQGGLEALNAGVTTVTDYCHNLLTPDHAHEAIRGVSESGLRTVWNYGFNYPPQEAPHFKSLEERLSFLEELAKQYFSSKDQLVTLGVAPEELLFAGGTEILDEQITAARAVDAHIFWHANMPGETPPREVAKLHDASLLGPDITFVHMAGTEPDEWKLLADHGASVAFTPDTELQMGMACPSSHIARRYGVNQVYGTDIVSNNSADMFTALRLGLQGVRAYVLETDGPMHSGVPITCNEVLKWGTIDAARALGMDSVIGSISPGKRADIVLLRADTLTLAGWDRSNVASAIVLHAQSADVDTVWVNGKIVKRDGKLLADTKFACGLLQAASERLHDRIVRHGGFALSEEEAMRRVMTIASTEHGQYDFSS